MERLREHPGEDQRTCPFPLYWQQKLMHTRIIHVVVHSSPSQSSMYIAVTSVELHVFHWLPPAFQVLTAGPDITIATLV